MIVFNRKSIVITGNIVYFAYKYKRSFQECRLFVQKYYT